MRIKIRKRKKYKKGGPPLFEERQDRHQLFYFEFTNLKIK